MRWLEDILLSGSVAPALPLPNDGIFVATELPVELSVQSQEELPLQRLYTS